MWFSSENDRVSAISSFVLGQRPMRWADVRLYVEALRGLLRGEDVEWEGAVIRMAHPPGFAPERP